MHNIIALKSLSFFLRFIRFFVHRSRVQYIFQHGVMFYIVNVIFIDHSSFSFSLIRVNAVCPCIRHLNQSTSTTPCVFIRDKERSVYINGRQISLVSHSFGILALHQWCCYCYYYSSCSMSTETKMYTMQSTSFHSFYPPTTGTQCIYE